MFSIFKRRSFVDITIEYNFKFALRSYCEPEGTQEIIEYVAKSIRMQIKCLIRRIIQTSQKLLSFF